ncbi:MAG: hypothetical protein ACKO0Z_11685 [Betaproteobacteria bacterium]
MKEALALRDKVARMQHSTKRAREKAGEVVKDLVRAAEVSGVAAALGYFQGKRAADSKESLKVFNVPLELVTGVAGHTLAAMGVAGAEDHFKAIADGALATYFSTLGYTAGKSGKDLLASTKGDDVLSLPGVSGQSLTVDDLAKMANV